MCGCGGVYLTGYNVLSLNICPPMCMSMRVESSLMCECVEKLALTLDVAFPVRCCESECISVWRLCVSVRVRVSTVAVRHADTFLDLSGMSREEALNAVEIMMRAAGKGEESVSGGRKR